jgi:hypothetical protein
MDSDLLYVGEDDAQFFRRLHSRTLNALNPNYLLPADDDERRVSHIRFLVLSCPPTFSQAL